MIDRVGKAGNGRARGRLAIQVAKYQESQVYCALCGESGRQSMHESSGYVVLLSRSWLSFGEVEGRGCELYRYRRLVGAR